MTPSIAQRRDRGRGHRLLQLEGKEPVAAQEVALEERMLRVTFQPGVQHPNHIRLRLQPAGHRQCRLLVHAQSRIDRADAPQDQPGIVTAHADAQLPHRRPQLLPQRLAYHRSAHQHVGVATPVLGQRRDGDVHAPVERPRQPGRSIGIVDGGQDAALARPGADGRHILDLEGVATRALQIDHPGVSACQLLQILGCGQRIEVDGAHPELGQQRIGKGACRPVDRIAHQDLITWRSECPHYRGDRCQAGGHKRSSHGVGRPFQLGHGIHQRIGGLGAGGGVGGMVQLAPIRAPAGLNGRLHRLEDHAGCPDHRRVDHLDGSTDATACLDRLTARHPRVPPRQGRCLMFFHTLSGTGGPGRLLVRHDETPSMHRCAIAPLRPDGNQKVSAHSLCVRGIRDTWVPSPAPGRRYSNRCRGTESVDGSRAA